MRVGRCVQCGKEGWVNLYIPHLFEHMGDKTLYCCLLGEYCGECYEERLFTSRGNPGVRKGLVKSPNPSIENGVRFLEGD